MQNQVSYTAVRPVIVRGRVPSLWRGSDNCCIIRGGDKRINNNIRTLTAGENQRIFYVNPTAITHVEAKVNLNYI